jgi:hypothetical protein
VSLTMLPWTTSIFLFYERTTSIFIHLRNQNLLWYFYINYFNFLYALLCYGLRNMKFNHKTNKIWLNLFHLKIIFKIINSLVKFINQSSLIIYLSEYIIYHCILLHYFVSIMSIELKALFGKNGLWLITNIVDYKY